MEARCFCFKNEGGNTATPRLGTGLCVKNQQVGNGTIGDEHFRPVEQVASIGWTCSGLDAHSIRARVLFGET